MLDRPSDATARREDGEDEQFGHDVGRRVHDRLANDHDVECTPTDYAVRHPVENIGLKRPTISWEGVSQ